MFDPFDQVRMRTEQLLASASRIREERALRAAHNGVSEATATASPTSTEPARTQSPVAPSGNSTCSESPTAPTATRSRAA